MWNQENRPYKRKNWSSVMLMNCAYHHAHKLTPENVATQTGEWLHQFHWATDNRIGELPPEWNCLVGEQTVKTGAKLLHFTLGLPGVHSSPFDDLWHEERAKMNHVTEKS
jgi:hypothetical protein